MFDQACVQFIADGKSTMVGAVDVVNPARNYFKNTLVKDITAKAIRRMANELYGHCTNASKNRLGITPVQSVINHCAELELCSPVKVKRFKEESKEKTPATLAWVEAFMAEAKPHLGAYALFMFLTGARPSEALAVDRERDLNLRNATVIIRQTKTVRDANAGPKERVAHLPPILVEALANLPVVPGRPLFVYRTYGALVRTWNTVAERAGIAALTPHCCRHGFATELMRRRVDVVTIAKKGGWASPAQVLKTYGHAIEQRDLTNILTDKQLTSALDEVAATARKVSGF
jgi:integrase